MTSLCVDCSECEEAHVAHSDQGIVKTERAEEQPADKARAQTAHESKSPNAVSREATRDADSNKSGSGRKPDDQPEGSVRE
jgi:hypothetical protein